MGVTRSVVLARHFRWANLAGGPKKARRHAAGEAAVPDNLCCRAGTGALLVAFAARSGRCMARTPANSAFRRGIAAHLPGNAGRSET
ncbi:hypothetical protein BCAR13_830006 [Paraburkholderia caribensis]|nr:hypothetical protein BCAR13_830006 [Paraburkholderia caribensis]